MSKQLQTFNPTTGAPLKSYEMMTDGEMNSAIDACQKAFSEWRLKPLSERAEVIGKIADKLGEYKKELSTLMVEEMGKLYSQAEQEIDLCMGIIKYTAKNGPEELKPETRDIMNGKEGVVAEADKGLIQVRFGELVIGGVTQAGRVIAFEPHPGNVALLRSNAAANECGHVEIIESALSDSAGTLTLPAMCPGRP